MAGLAAARRRRHRRPAPAAGPAAAPAPRHRLDRLDQTHRRGPRSGCAGCPATGRPGPRWAGLPGAGPDHRRPDLLPEGRRGGAPVARGAGRDEQHRRRWSRCGALANARHDFAAARAHAPRRDRHQRLRRRRVRRARRRARPSSATRPRRPTAVQRLLDLRPGLSAYARASYDLEQRGQIGRGDRPDAPGPRHRRRPADIAFCRNQLGDLAWHAGDLAAAAREYAAGLRRRPDLGRPAAGTGPGGRGAAATSTARSPATPA